MTKNPFRPTFGISPQVWKGREAVIEEFQQAIAGGPGAPARSLVIDGARGIGKTALVGELVDVAESAGWVSLRTRSTSSIAETLRDSLIPSALQSLDSRGRRSKRALESVNIAGLGGLGTSVTTESEPVPTLELRLRELLGALKEHGAGVLITIDEVQDAEAADLSEIAGAYQMLLQEEWDIALIVTGLSEGVQRLLNLRGTTFMRRAQRFTLGGLTMEDSIFVLTKTAGNGSISFDEAAAQTAAEMSYGYPYLLQLIGHLAWRRVEKQGSAVITARDVAAIRDEAVAMMGEQVHEPSLKGLPARLREFLQCMAQAEDDLGTAAIAEVAECMGRPVTGLSDLRQRLMDRELIESTDWGSLEFTLPYLGEYLRKRPTRRKVH